MRTTQINEEWTEQSSEEGFDMVTMPFIMTSEPKLEKIKLTKANGKGRRLKQAP